MASTLLVWPETTQHIPYYEVLRLKGYSDGSTTDVIIKLAGATAAATANSLIINQTSQACRGLRSQGR